MVLAQLFMLCGWRSINLFALYAIFPRDFFTNWIESFTTLCIHIAHCGSCRPNTLHYTDSVAHKCEIDRCQFREARFHAFLWATSFANLNNHNLQPTAWKAQYRENNLHIPGFSDSKPCAKWMHITVITRRLITNHTHIHHMIHTCTGQVTWPIVLLICILTIINILSWTHTHTHTHTHTRTHTCVYGLKVDFLWCMQPYNRRQTHSTIT
jgi:hypothetical protein